MNIWTAGFIGVGLMVLVFLLSWIWAVSCDNYSLVDAVWAGGIGLTGNMWLMLGGRGSLKIWVAGALLAIWGSRLVWHLQRRIRRAYPEEDARYTKLREAWVDHLKNRFFWFFQAQGLTVVLLSLPFLFIAFDSDRHWGGWEASGACVVLLGILGESLADFQMSAFKAEKHVANAVCQNGLWRYSRHPNYFFEAVIWFGFYIYACRSDWGWATIHAPAMIVFLLLKVTGIPPTEAAAILSKGDAYRRYQQSTSPFIPWRPKRAI